MHVSVDVDYAQYYTPSTYPNWSIATGNCPFVTCSGETNTAGISSGTGTGDSVMSTSSSSTGTATAAASPSNQKSGAGLRSRSGAGLMAFILGAWMIRRVWR